MIQLRICLDISNQRTDGLDVFNFLIGNLDLKLVLDGHQQVNDIQRIRAEIFLKIGILGDLILFHVELLSKDCLNFVQYHFVFKLKKYYVPVL